MTTPPITDSAATQGKQDKMDQTTTMEFSGAELGMVLNSLSVAIGVLQEQDVRFAVLATVGTAMKLGQARTQALLDKIKAKLDESFTDPANGIRTVSEEDGPEAVLDLVKQAAAKVAMQPPINKEVA